MHDNEFHYALYELAGRKNISLFYSAVNSQYERFRTFINLGGKDDLVRLCEDHERIWECISTKNFEKLENSISHHIYDGFNGSTENIYKHPEYFKSINK